MRGKSTYVVFINLSTRDGAHAALVATEGKAQTFAVQKTGTNGFLDIVSGEARLRNRVNLIDNRYKGGVYQDVACYDASWTMLGSDEVRELQEPLITPCTSVKNNVLTALKIGLGRIWERTQNLETPSKSHRINEPLVLVRAHNPKVVGSNPTPATRNCPSELRMPRAWTGTRTLADFPGAIRLR